MPDSSALSSFLANASMATSAFPAAANTTAAVLLAEARALQHRLEEHYSPAAAYASYYSAFLTLSDVVAPAPPASDGARSSGGGSSSRAVALAVALVVAALGLLAGGVFLAKRYGCGFGTGPCRRRQRLSWRSDAPGASPRTTLLITGTNLHEMCACGGLGRGRERGRESLTGPHQRRHTWPLHNTSTVPACRRY